MPRPRGHGNYPIRPGLIIRDHLIRNGESNPTAIFQSYKEVLDKTNEARYDENSRACVIHGMVFSSFYRYMKHLEYFELLYRTGREEPMIGTNAPLLQIRTKPRKKVVAGVLVFYDLTETGKAEPIHPAFFDPVGTWLDRHGYIP